MPPNEYAALHESLERVLDAVSGLRGDVRAYAATQQEHARRLNDLEAARHESADRVALAAATTGRFSVSAEMFAAACQERHRVIDERISAVAKVQSKLAWWTLGTAGSLMVGLIVAAVVTAMRSIGG